PVDEAERIRLRQMPQRVGGLGADPFRIGIRDPDEHLFGAVGRAAQVFEVAVVERLEPPVDHAPGDHHSTTTPEPSSTRPTLRMKSFRAVNSASSEAARSPGTEMSRPPAV